jgi:hypothetical protein
VTILESLPFSGENQVDQSCRSQQRDTLVGELLETEMQFPSSALVQQSSVAESERAESKCLAGDPVEAGVCQIAVKTPQRIGMKSSPTRPPSGGLQYSSDSTLEGFQGGIENRIENLMQGPVVVGRDDEMPARLQDTEDLS